MSRKKFGIFFLSCILLFFIVPTETLAVQDVIQEQMYFSGDGVISNGKEEVKSELFDSILKSEELEIIAHMSSLAEKEFSDNTLMLDLDVYSGEMKSLWGYDLNGLYETKSPTYFYIRVGNTKYDFAIPRGKYFTGSSWTSVNQKEIKDAISSLTKYKKVVKDAIMAGSVPPSINVYTMYSEKQIPVSDILEKATSKEGTNLGYNQIKASASGIKYQLDNYYNPILGKIDGAKIEPSKTAKLLADGMSKLKITPSTEGKATIDISKEYRDFITDQDQRMTLSTVKATATGNKGVMPYKTPITKKSVEPQNMADSGMRLIVPFLFEKNRNGNNYILDSNKGFKMLEGVRLHITHFMVYGEEGDSLKRLGDYNSYSIDDKSLVMYHTVIGGKKGEDGKVTGGKKVGAVIPLWYKEAVIDTTNNDVSTGKDVLFTGRMLKLGEGYSGKIGIGTLNRDLFSADVRAGGKQATSLRNFAFKEGSDYKERDSHASTENIPDTFEININFETSEEEGAKGFVMFRNNWYSSDPELSLWLQSNEAKAMTEVNTKRLLEILNGIVSPEKTEMSYEEWNRLQEISGELNVTLKDRLFLILRVVAMIFGIVLVVYATLLVLLYWFDIFVTFTDLSLVHLMTFKRYYPVASKEELEHMTGTGDGNIKYVDIFGILWVAFWCIALGIFFVFCTPVVEFLLFIYYKVKNLLT